MKNELNSNCPTFFLQKKKKLVVNLHQHSILPLLIGVYIQAHKIPFPSLRNDHLTQANTSRKCSSKGRSKCYLSKGCLSCMK